jgi:hypothetical protein
MFGPKITFAPRRFDKSAAISDIFALSAFKESPIISPLVMLSLCRFLGVVFEAPCGGAGEFCAWGFASTLKKTPAVEMRSAKKTLRKYTDLLEAAVDSLATTKEF